MSEERPGAMTAEGILGQARDALTVKRVFGEPIERNGITLVPVAAVRGGGGGGGGQDQGGNVGSGGGFGISARPVGAYQIKGDEVTWLPAVDTSRIVVLGQVVGLVALLVLRSIVRGLARRRG
jgi:uncharacterized spore protein YtfJ